MKDNKNKDIEILLPFSGFYESIHIMNIELVEDIEMEQDTSFDDLPIDYRQVFLEYARAYTLHFGKALQELTSSDNEVEFVFKELSSPREYNFHTDTISALISYEDLKQLFRVSDTTTLKAEVLEQGTNKSGFESYFPSNLDDWLQVLIVDWEPVQLKVVLDAILTYNNCPLVDFEESVLELANIGEVISNG